MYRIKHDVRYTEFYYCFRNFQRILDLVLNNVHYYKDPHYGDRYLWSSFEDVRT